MPISSHPKPKPPPKHVSKHSITNIPFTILQNIFSYLPDTTHYECRQVCKTWANYLQNSKATRKLLNQKHLGVIRMTIQAKDKNMIHDFLVKSYSFKFKNLSDGKTLRFSRKYSALNLYQVDCADDNDVSNFGIYLKLSGSTKLVRNESATAKYLASQINCLSIEQLNNHASLMKLNNKPCHIFIDQDQIFKKALKITNWYETARKLKLLHHLPYEIPETRLTFSFIKTVKPAGKMTQKHTNKLANTTFSTSLNQVILTIVIRDGKCDISSVQSLELADLSGNFGGIFQLVSKNAYLVHVRKTVEGKVELTRVLLGKLEESSENSRMDFDQVYKMVLQVENGGEFRFWFGKNEDESKLQLFDYEIK